MRRAAAPSCSQPEIAVCVVGQLRAAARPKLARNLRAAWDRVGPGCVDLYLHIGLEAQVATANHRALRGSSYENASVAAVALRPVEWRATTYPLVRPNANCTMDDGGGAASATVCQKRPFNERANQTETGCGDASCTHCSASAYFPQAIRIAACAGMVMEAQKRLARPYRYFAFHRPDMWLYGIPPYAGWAFADAGLTRTALFCDGGASYVYDIFALMSYTQVPIVAGLGGLYARCQSKHENLALGCLASGWPQWCTKTLTLTRTRTRTRTPTLAPTRHQSECILKTAFARQGVATATATMWPAFLRSCRVVREKGFWSSRDARERRYKSV